MLKTRAHRSLGWWRVIDTRRVQGPQHHFLEEFDVHSIYQVDVGRLADYLFAVVDHHLPACVVATQLDRGVMQRFLCHIPGVDGSGHGQLVTDSENKIKQRREMI